MSVRLALLTLFAIASLTPLFAADWPQWRGPDRTGVSKETGINHDWDVKKPTLLWMAEGAGAGYAGVSVVGGQIFTTGNFEKGQGVACFSIGGKLDWKTPVTDNVPKHGYEGSRCTPTVDGDRLYAIFSDGTVACLKTDGNIVWKRNFKDWKGRMMSGWGFSESPLVDGPWMLCTPGGPEAMVVALDKLTGEEVWRSAVPKLGKKGNEGAGYSSLVISNACGVKQYVQLGGSGTFGLRASDGKFLWGYNQVANNTANIPTPVVTGDYVFTSSGYGEGGSALLKLKKTEEGVEAEEVYWLPANKLQNHHGGMLLQGDYIYFGAKHDNGFPVCVDFKNADEPIKWGGDKRGPGSGSAAVVLVDGHIIFRYQNGIVALVEATPEGYHLKGSFKPEYQERESWAHPVVSDGKLYLREQNKLMCYDLK
jgi:hypothetical protein